MAGNLTFGKWQNDDGSENFKCRAWVNFNGTGTVAIRGSGNVSSITDAGVGLYIVNFVSAMSDTNYSVSGVLGQTTVEDGISYSIKTASPNTGRLTTSVRICTAGNSTFVDFTDVNALIFR